LQDVGATLGQWRAYDPRPPKVFFGPVMDYCYAAFDLPVEPGLPLWWENVPSTHHGENYPIGTDMPAFMYQPSRWIGPGEKLDYRVANFINARFDLCLFFVETKTGDLPLMDYLPPDVRAEIYENYGCTYRGHIAVFKRKD